MKTFSEIQDDMHKLTYELKRQEKKYAQLLKKFRDLRKEANQLKAAEEKMRMQLVACGVIAMSNTRETAAKQRDIHPDYKSSSCQNVMDAVDREMALREERDILKEKLAASQRLLASGILYTYQQLVEHDAQVIGDFIAEVAQCTYMAIDIDEDYAGAAELVVNFVALQNRAKQLQQKTQESS